MNLAQRFMMAFGGSRLPLGFGGRAPAGLPRGINARIGAPAVPTVAQAITNAMPFTASHPLRLQASADGSEAELLIFDVIGEDYWTGGGVTAQAVVSTLNALAGVDLKIRINSVGGDVMDGTAIINTLTAYKGKTTASIEGWACSMATGIACACDHVTAASNVMWMIHRASTVVWGMAQDLRDTADMMDKVDNAIVAIYASKTGKSADEINGLLNEKRDTWLSADEAKEWGFIDEVTPAGRFTACLDENSIKALTAGEGAQLLLTATLPTPLVAVLGDKEPAGVVRVDGDTVAMNNEADAPAADTPTEPPAAELPEGTELDPPAGGNGDGAASAAADAADTSGATEPEEEGDVAGQGATASVDPVLAERERARIIRAAASTAGLPKLADRLIEQGISAEDAQQQILAIKESLDDQDDLENTHPSGPQGKVTDWSAAYSRAGAKLK